MAEVGVPIRQDGLAVHPDCWCVFILLQKIQKMVNKDMTFGYHPVGAPTKGPTCLFDGPLSGTTWVSQYQKGKTSLDLLEQQSLGCSGISWAIRKSAPHPWQITTPAPHHSVFYRLKALPAVNQQRRSTEGKRQPPN